MDSESSKLFILHDKLGGLVSHPICSSEGTEKDCLHSSFRWKHPGETFNTPWNQVVDIQAFSNNLAGPLMYKANEAGPCTGSEQMLPNCPQTSGASCTVACHGGPHFLECHPWPIHLSLSNGGIELSGDLAKASQAQSNKGDLLDTHQQRFLTFNYSGTNKGMLFYSSLANAFAEASPPPRLKKADMSSLVLASERERGGKDASLFRSSFPPATCVSLHGTPADFANNPWPCPVVMDSRSSTSDNCYKSHFADTEKLVEIETDHDDGTPEFSYISHENTEDIEALLSSDVDEVSTTGHSPSEMTKRHSLSAGLSTAKSMKRKGHDVDDGDVCSTATSGNMAGKLICSQNVLGNVGPEAKEAAPFQGIVSLKGYDLATLGMPLADDVTSYSSTCTKKQCRNSRNLQQLPQTPVPTDLSRKEKIKNILRLLRGVVPGGENMETACVLDEAIQYVRTLQSEVEKLQAKKVI